MRLSLLNKDKVIGSESSQVNRTLRKDADRCEDEYGKYGMGTNYFFIGVMEKHEKMAWMLRAHLDK